MYENPSSILQLARSCWTLCQAVFPWVANCYGLAPFPPTSAGGDPLEEDELLLLSPPEPKEEGQIPDEHQKVLFSALSEHAQEGSSLPPPSFSPGDEERTAPLRPAPETPPQPAPRARQRPPPPEPEGPPRPAPRVLPRRVPPTAAPQPAPRKRRAAPPAAASVLLDDGAAAERPPPSPPDAAEPVPCPAEPSPDTETSAEPAQPSECSSVPPPPAAAAAAAPAPSVFSLPSSSDCPGAAPAGLAGTGEQGSALSFRGGGMARQLGAGAARLQVFKISIFAGFGGGFSGVALCRFLSLPPFVSSSSGEEAVGSEKPASAPQPGGGAGNAWRQMGAAPSAFTLQRQRAQPQATIARLLWGANIPTPEITILGRASVSPLPARLDFGGRKPVGTHFATVLAAGCQAVGMLTLPRGLGLGCLNWLLGPGPPPGLLLVLGVLPPPSGPGPPFCGPGVGSLILPHWPGPPRAFFWPPLLLLLFLI
ncbi:uncharacterized protein GJ701_016261 [Geothlypis trichas]